MHKLIILIGEAAERAEFHAQWPRFLRRAEQMPGLLREASVQVEARLYGPWDVRMIHELYFESRQALDAAMRSLVGKTAGATLQDITGGRFTLLIAEHAEDDMENIRQHRAREDEDEDA
ncbi:MAG: hypothetical protein D6803_03615 [Anaerolineae bacterium]|nr:MAG: hypothetical protein D6803_03615 [Anaerolineae bacterium]